MWVRLSWAGVRAPATGDWVGLLVPADADPAMTTPAKFKFAADAPGYLKNGAGELRCVGGKLYRLPSTARQLTGPELASVCASSNAYFFQSP
jgi:hypothetical protein